MSSILDALKKAEQESTKDRGMDIPWLPLPAQSPYRQRSRRWWVPLGILVALGLSGVVVWQTRRPDTVRPAVSVPAVSPSAKAQGSMPPPIAGSPSTVPVAVQAPARPAIPLAKPVPRQAPKTMHTFEPGKATPTAAAPPMPPANQSSRGVDPPSVPVAPPFPLKQSPQGNATPTSKPAVIPPAAPSPPSAEPLVVTGQPVAEPPPEANKTFRNDPRIDLQALVWAPKADARFVVINNRLIKEGGSVDNVIIVKINPDDVLLAEGADQWHVEFKVR